MDRSKILIGLHMFQLALSEINSDVNSPKKQRTTEGKPIEDLIESYAGSRISPEEIKEVMKMTLEDIVKVIDTREEQRNA